MIYDATSDQDMQIEVSSTQAPMDQINAVKPMVNRDNNNYDSLPPPILTFMR